MRNIISLVTIILGFTLIVLTIIYKNDLTSDHCFGVGFVGFMTIIIGRNIID